MNRSTHNNIHRALRTALVVGPILTLINQTPALAALLRGEGIPLVTLGRISLTFVVPFLVSFYSATMADRARQRTLPDETPRDVARR